MRKHSLLSWVTVIFLAGCSLAPDLNVPKTDVPTQTQSSIQNVDKTWWKAFNDPTLNALIDEALTNNDDIKLQTLKVLKARQTYTYTTDLELPTINATANTTRNRLSDETYQHNRALYTDNFIGASLSYELDLWGKLSSASEASLSNYLATKAAQQTVKNTLINDVFNAYLNLAAQRMRIDTLEQNAKAYKESYEFRLKQQKAGMSNDVLAHQALAQYNNAKASLESLKQSYTLQKSALEILLGHSPKALFEGSTVNAHLPERITIPEGIPSSLLESRPDIQEALETLRSKNALIGVEKAAYFPTFSLTGSFGQQSETLGFLMHSSANKWSFGPSLSVPIFDFGRIKQRVAISETELQTALVSYEQTVKKSYKEVYDALSKQTTLRQQRLFQEEELKAYQSVLALNTKRFEQGMATQLEVIDAQKNVLSSSLNLIITQQAELSAQAELFKVLGGGWTKEDLLTR